MGLQLLNLCDEVWVCGSQISNGMSREIEQAIQTGKVIVDMTVQEQEMQMTAM